MTELIGGLSWTAGASTTLSVASGFARATATAAPTNPRIYKGPFALAANTTYRMTGKIYQRTAGVNMYFRISVSATLTAGDYFQLIGNGTVDLNGITFSGGAGGNAYIGIIPVVNVNGEYGEIDDSFAIDTVASNTDTTKLAYGGPGAIADAARRAVATSTPVLMTNQQLKESGAGFWADMARQGGTVIS